MPSYTLPPPSPPHTTLSLSLSLSTHHNLVIEETVILRELETLMQRKPDVIRLQTFLSELISLLFQTFNKKRGETILLVLVLPEKFWSVI